MRSAKGSLKERLARYRQIKLGVIGRKSGQTISNPVWALPNVTPRHRSANVASAITLSLAPRWQGRLEIPPFPENWHVELPFWTR